jgi:23S rRNA (pseudouridine1915-N3)-methyltransferase
MTFTILSISDSDKHFSSAIQEYEKRLWKLLNIQNVKPSKESNREVIIKKDTENLIAILKNKFWSYKKVLLTKDGKELDTNQIKDFCYKNWNIVFVIWWPYWLDEKMIDDVIDEKISFGKITLPHGLAKLVLIEQIYRIRTIETWKNYHY